MFSLKYPIDLIEKSINKIKEVIKEEALFLPFHPKQLEFYKIDEIKEQLENHLQQLTLVVTEQCNLRCKYCVYSGTYYFERKYSSARMSTSTALKAIDFFFSHNRIPDKIFLSFYGGELLLNFNLIKKCVEYTKIKNKEQIK